MKIKKELLGSKLRKGHLTIILDNSKNCISLCKKLKLNVFEDAEPRTKSK